MIVGPVLIDTNVLVLYVAGSTARPIIAAHKRCSQFTAEDYDLLLDLIGRDPDLVLLPNVVTEASNLLAQIADPYLRSPILIGVRSCRPYGWRCCSTGKSMWRAAEPCPGSNTGASA